jgi:hypothetical protein
MLTPQHGAGGAAEARLDRAVVLTSPQPTESIDWERLEFVMRAMRHVDAATVEDQWILTRRYLADRRVMRTRTLLELLAAHIARLRQLRFQATDARLYRELSIMLAQTLFAAGQNWTGLTDFGMALEAYRSMTAIGDELDENWLRTTGLLSQAQLSGIHAIAPWTQSARMALIEETESGANGASHQVRVWFHATRAQMHALMGREPAALDSLELATSAQVRLTPDAGFYFGMADPVYLPIQEGSVDLLFGRPLDALTKFRAVAARVEPNAIAIRAWVAAYVAAAYAEAGDAGEAAAALREAQTLAEMQDCPLLLHSVARYTTEEPPAPRSFSTARVRHQLDTSS